MANFRDWTQPKREPPRTPLGEIAVATSAAMRVPVFPCNSQKRPVTGHGYKDASLDPTTIMRMFCAPGAALIGMPTGLATGWDVIDVDVKDGAPGAAWFEANRHRLPETKEARTRSGGRHLYFRARAIGTVVARVAPGVDNRSDGGYVVIPPSDGYTWSNDAMAAAMPDWLYEVARKQELPQAPEAPRVAGVAGAASSSSYSSEGGEPYALQALANECDNIRYASDGTKHSAINKAAYAIGGLVASGALERAVALSELQGALSGILHRCKDQRAAQRTLHDGFRDGQAKPRDVPERTAVAVLDEVHPAAAFLAKIKQRAALTRAKPIPVAAGLMDVGGVLGAFVEHCNETAISPQPFLALAAGICAIGVLAGRRYRSKTDLRTNIYAVSLCDSGGGKDHARKRVRAIFAAAGLTRYLGGDDIASGSAIHTALLRHPALLFQIDEAGDWLGGVLGQNAPAHKKQIAEKFKTLYSSAGGYVGGTEYADQSRAGRPKEDVQAPHLCFYGTSTPGQFWSAIKEGSMHDGLLARMLIFATANNYPDDQEVWHVDAPDDLVAAFQEIAAGVEGHDDGDLGGLMSAATVPRPYEVPETDEAAACIGAMRRAQKAFLRENEGTYLTSIYARWTENAIKLAMVRAISRDPQAPMIEESDVAWARDLTEHCIGGLAAGAERHVANSEFEANVKRVLEMIRKHGPVTRTVMQRSHGLVLKDRDWQDVISNLMGAGLVNLAEETKSAAGGRPTQKYVAT